ncbi:hypothetical protein NDU88_003161 [Pleurodeles waltl]|uniref:Uncharacterized protein n=1 Tax=Pleurodeles waltl TaxID=8319 RepID=A0AAV7UBB2_PLEWA|nr:hypothetical protein NDU88_003161 [Pleurodeles waltl]
MLKHFTLDDNASHASSSGSRFILSDLDRIDDGILNVFTTDLDNRHRQLALMYTIMVGEVAVHTLIDIGTVVNIMDNDQYEKLQAQPCWESPRSKPLHTEASAIKMAIAKGNQKLLTHFNITKEGTSTFWSFHAAEDLGLVSVSLGRRCREPTSVRFRRLPTRLAPSCASAGAGSSRSVCLLRVTRMLLSIQDAECENEKLELAGLNSPVEAIECLTSVAVASKASEAVR